MSEFIRKCFFLLELAEHFAIPFLRACVFLKQRSGRIERDGILSMQCDVVPECTAGSTRFNARAEGRQKTVVLTTARVPSALVVNEHIVLYNLGLNHTVVC